jgi:hypothetical protein
MCNSPPSDTQPPCSSATKLDAMKKSAKDLIGIVVREDQSKFTTKVAIVPFSDSVRLPSSAVSNARGTPPKIVKKSSGSKQYIYNLTESCVVERSGSNRYTDGAPGSGNYSMPLRLLVATINNSDGTVLIDNNSSKVQGSAATITWKSGSTLNKTAKDKLLAAANSFATCGLPASAEVMPLSSSRDALEAKIEGLGAKGGTAGQVGTAWAWYMLAPDWGSLWPTTGPVAYGTPDLRKVAVLMTDGEYNTEYTSDGILTGSPGAGSSPANSDSATQAKELCTNTKAKGIEVYTVGFQVSSSAASLLRNCATEPTWFYDAKNPEQLAQSYRDIALKLSALYLSK